MPSKNHQTTTRRAQEPVTSRVKLLHLFRGEFIPGKAIYLFSAIYRADTSPFITIGSGPTL